MKTTFAPISGFALSTVLVTFRSAFCGVTVATAVSSPVEVWFSSREKTEAVLVMAELPVTVPVMVIDAEAPGPRIPTAQRCVPTVYVPWLGVTTPRVKPTGQASFRTTLLAVFVLLLVTPTVKVTVSPTFGVA